jgi:hypothetical protein
MESSDSVVFRVPLPCVDSIDARRRNVDHKAIAHSLVIAMLRGVATLRR